MSTPIAVASALVAALFLGISSVADERSTKRVKTRRALLRSLRAVSGARASGR